VKGNVTIELVFPWWTGAYLNALVLFCMTFGTEPDVERCARFIVSHSTFRAARA